MVDIFDLFNLSWLLSLHSHIVISLGSYALACILASLLPRIFWFICPFRHPSILISIGLYVLACILASLHLHILRFVSFSLYPRILASSYPQVHVCLLVFLHFTFSYHQVHVCLLVSLQAFAFDFYCTSREICRKQPLWADQKKVVVKI